MDLNEKEKTIIKLKSLLVSILMILISISIFFFIAVLKVDAANAIGGYNGANDTSGVWWSDTNYDYTCGTTISNTCGTFDRALAILYNFQPNTSDTLTFTTSIYTQADYTSNKTWNNQVYVLWGYGSNLYYDWTLQDSCTIDGTQETQHINSLTDRKLYYVSISCTASPPVNGAYPVIYNLQRYSNDTWGGLSNYNFYLGYTNGTITQNRDDTAIINSGNQNTQAIINNDNDNTQAIIDSQNQNAEDTQNTIKDQFISCDNYNINSSTNFPNNNKRLLLDGSLNDISGFQVSNYIPINIDTTYVLNARGNAIHYCLYDKNKTLIQCYRYNNSLSFNITPTQDGYIRLTRDNTDTNFSFSGQYCYNRLDGQPHDYGSQPDSTTTNDYHTKENELIDNFNSSQLNVVDISVDTTSNKWVWDRITEYINLNSVITTMIVTIMSLGVIKLVMNR